MARVRTHYNAPGVQPASPMPGPPPPGEGSSQYRRTFVGRQAELQQLRATFDAAMSGHGGLVALAGEPGIGKTALCERLTDYVAECGGRTLWGHCYEAGSLSLPYLPFVEAIDDYVRSSEPRQLEADLGSGAPEVARIAPDVGLRLQVEPRSHTHPEDERWRLLQSVITFLRNAARRQPILLVLEDLHDADHGTLDLLVHLSRPVSNSYLLVVGTYRDVEVDRAHPLSATLAELRRSPQFSRLPLRGLSVAEVHQMYCQVRGQDVPWSRADAVHRQTEGNPLFVQEVLRYLVEAGLVVRHGSRYVPADAASIETEMPEGLRDVVGKRLSRLSPRTNEVLAIAAVIGREFRLDVLQHVADMSEEDVVASLEEAHARAIIEERGGVVGALGFRFTHAFFRQTLYEEIFAPRRVRWHRLVAAALEDVYAGGLDEHAGELAEHFSQSTDPGDLTRAVKYGELAANRARAVYAYAEAARHLQRALQLQEVLDSKNQARVCDLLLDLGEALMPAGEPERAAEQIATRAFGLAERLGDAQRASRACQVALEGMMRYSAGAVLGSPPLVEWSGRADRWAPPDGPSRVFAEVALGLVRRSELRLTECMDHFSRAIDLARALPDAEPVFFAAGHMLVPIWSPAQLPMLLSLADDVCARSREGVSAQSLSRVLRFGQVIYLASGKRSRAEALWQEGEALASQAGDAFVLILPDLFAAFRATLDGDLETAVERAAAISQRGDELGMAAAGSRWRFSLVTGPLLWMGDHTRFSAELDMLTDAMGLAFNANWWLWGSGVGAMGLAKSGMLPHQPKLVDQDPGSTAGALATALELAVAAGDGEGAARAASQFEGVAAVPIMEFGLANVARLIGRAAVLSGELDAARKHYARALEWATAIRHRPEVALTRLELAELLLASYPSERPEALEHLDFAVAEFGAMRMQPGLERAVELQRTTVPSASAAARAVRVAADPLTTREREVAALMARGLSNREIADALVITEGTAEVHVKHILGKLGFKSRSQVAVWATQQDLAPAGTRLEEPTDKRS